MNWLELAKVIKEVGLATGAFALCAWIVVYIVKRVAVNLDKLTLVLDKMISKQDLFMLRVKNEHDAAAEDHKEFAKQNKEITSALLRVNGYKDK